MWFFEELHCKLCSQLNGAKFVSSNVKDFDTYFTLRLSVTYLSGKTILDW